VLSAGLCLAVPSATYAGQTPAHEPPVPPATGPAQAPTQDTRAAPAATPVQASAQEAEAASPYYLAPGDVLRISVWKEPELTTEAVVRLDGWITVPLIGDIRAAGKTTEQLTTEVRTRLRAFLEVPQVTIFVSQAVSARFYVIGEVTTSGAHPLNARITVLQALALAGGFREFAKRDRIMIIREQNGQRRAIPFNFRDLETGINLDQNIALESGDTIIVP
jgi:polysaccharide export outer membrane protein